MNFLIWLIVGGVIGWIASMIMKTDQQQGIVLNIVVGIVGAMLGGWFISPLVGVPTINQDAFSMDQWPCPWSVRSSCWRSSIFSGAVQRADPLGGPCRDCHPGPQRVYTAAARSLFQAPCGMPTSQG